MLTLLMDAPQAVGPHQLLIFLAQVAALLAVARGLGELMRAWGQPAVIGELMAGVVLGPSLLGQLAPGLEAWLFPSDQRQADLLGAVSWLGVLMLLVITGMEVDLGLMVRKARLAVGISLGGILIPLTSGFALGQVMPEEFLGHADQRMVFSLFMAVAMSITAIPVIAKILLDLKLIRRDVGQITIASAMTDDSMGWILLSVVAGLAARAEVGPSTVLKAMVTVVLFMVLGLTLGRAMMARVLARADDFSAGPATQMSALLVMAFLLGCLSDALGIEAVLGCFVAGIVAGEAPRLRTEVVECLEIFTTSFVAPVFFATAGLKVNLMGLIEPKVALAGLAVLGVACVGKFLGCYLGGWVSGLSHWERLAMGAGMNARGAMEIIVATIGLNLGVLSQDCYSIIVSMAIITSLMAPPMLRWALARVTMGEDEASRLAAEERAEKSFALSLRRVLIPSRGGLNVQLAARLMGQLSHIHPVDITVLYVVLNGQREEPGQAVRSIQDSLEDNLTVRVVRGARVVDAILKEAERGYNLVVVGASEGPESHSLFKPRIEALLHNCSCPVLVVRAHEEGLVNLRRVLCPTDGGGASLKAVELAALFCAHQAARLTLVHVIPRYLDEDLHGQDRAVEVAEALLESQAELARGLGAEVECRVLSSNFPDKVLLRAANGYDLMVMGSTLRPLGGRAYLGHRTEAIMRRATCPVAVISTP